MAHTILVAFSVDAEDRQRAMEQIGEGLKEIHPLGSNNPWGIECYWQAEDDRIDGSDCDSAVFCNPGAQAQASRVLYDTIARNPHNGLVLEPLSQVTQIHNLVTREVRSQFDGGPV